MNFRKSLFIVLFWVYGQGISQQVQLTPEAQISVLTCGSGEDLYTTFGHSAFRVQDPNLALDAVYNYGTFNFNPPGFYLDFAKGKLIYQLSKENFPNFLYTYELEKRWVKEQLLDLTYKEKKDLYQFLEKNNLPENRDYKYDFFFDNCATRIRDVIKDVFGKGLIFKEDHLKKQYTFRQLIHQNLTTNSWSAFGIDLALGSVIDKKATPLEDMFLPAYVFKQLDNTIFNGKPLVQRERTVLNFDSRPNNFVFLFSPLFWFLLLLLLVFTITYIDYKNGTRSRWMDFFLFFITGLAGLIILLLWIATDHTATVNNFNVLWAFPINLALSFYMLRRTKLPEWTLRYVQTIMGLLLLAVLFWLIGIQQFSSIIIPLLVLMGARYLFLWHHIKSYKS